MFWFSVLTLMQGIRENNPNSAPFFDESLILVKAYSEEEAKKKAEKRCLKIYKTEHKIVDGDTVSWKFVKIIEVTDRCEKTLYDGIQIYSRIF